MIEIVIVFFFFKKMIQIVTEAFIYTTCRDD